MGIQDRDPLEKAVPEAELHSLDEPVPPPGGASTSEQLREAGKGFREVFKKKKKEEPKFESLDKSPRPPGQEPDYAELARRKAEVEKLIEKDEEERSK